MFLDYFIENFLLVYILEIGAALAGTYYLRKTRTAVPYSGLFVGYLWLVVGVETIGYYPVFNYFNDYYYLPFLKDTLFERNFWLYNVFKVITFAILYVFFIAQLQSKKSKRIFKWITFFFVLTAVLNLILTDVFFQKSSAFSFIIGTFILLTLIFAYYFELLKSDKILYFYKSLVFYISVGLLLWYVTVTPIFIFNKYFTSTSPEFVKLHATILNISNYFLYCMYILAFIIGSSNKKERLSSKNISRHRSILAKKR